MEKGMLQEYLLTDLKVPQSYELRLTPITRFGMGDIATRIIHYIEREFLFLSIIWQFLNPQRQVLTKGNVFLLTKS